MKAVFEHWGDLPNTAFRALVYMALVSMDADSPPRFWGGREDLATALGRELPAENPDDSETVKARNAIFKACRDATSLLAKRGAIRQVKAARAGRRQEWALNLRRQEHENRATTAKAGAPAHENRAPEEHENRASRCTENVGETHENCAPEEEQETGEKEGINQSARAPETDRPQTAEPDGLIDESSAAKPGNRITDDTAGRRWLVENLLLADDHATDVVAVVRRKYPHITCMPRYLDRMHREKNGTTKRELLDIVENVQSVGQQSTAGLEPEESSPERVTFERPQLCAKHRDAPEDPRPIGASRCLLCNQRHRNAERATFEQSPAPVTDGDTEAAKGFQLIADMIAKERDERERGKQRKTGYKAAVHRLPHSSDPALDAEREVVLCGEGHRDLPVVQAEEEVTSA